VAEPLSLPGFVNAHSHAFQRALRGRTEGDDFWGWREAMLAIREQYPHPIYWAPFVLMGKTLA
jgi:cytosine/adenosine deaminase-related metal-dependent hydrolase